MFEEAESNGSVEFVQRDIVFSPEGEGRISINFVRPSFLSIIVIDVFDLDNPSHPDGHIGWWAFQPDEISFVSSAFIKISGLNCSCHIDDISPVHFWQNDAVSPPDRVRVEVGIKSISTQEIVALDRVPGFKSDVDAFNFRSSVDRNWMLPRFAYCSDSDIRGGTIRIVSRNIFPRDAVGNLCLDIFRMLRQNSRSVSLYADVCDMSINDIVRHFHFLSDEVSPEDTILFFYSTYDSNLRSVIDLPVARRIAYFHGVTRPDLLVEHDWDLAQSCSNAYGQMSLLAHFDVLAANSRASAVSLISTFTEPMNWTEDAVRIIPPKLISRADLKAAGKKHHDDVTKFLYVGRLKGHKKIEDLIEFIAEYRRIDDTAQLWIVGDNSESPYVNFLKEIEIRLFGQCSRAIRWVGAVSDEDLKFYYENSTAYISMSEDEGFCLPVLEAMLSGLPVFAYAVPALVEVLDGSGFTFSEKNFKVLAREIQNLIKTNTSSIVCAQRRRSEALMDSMDGGLFLDLLFS